MVYGSLEALKGEVVQVHDKIVLYIDEREIILTVQDRYLGNDYGFWNRFYDGGHLRYKIASRIYQFPSTKRGLNFPETAATGDLAMRDLTRIAIFLFIAIEKISQIAQSTGKTFKEASKDADYDLFIQKARALVPIVLYSPSMELDKEKPTSFLIEKEEDSPIGNVLYNKHNHFKNILT